MDTLVPAKAKLGSVANSAGYRVTVTPTYVPEQSDAEQRRYIFEYSVQVRNVEGLPATIRSRHWVIVDELARINDVRGEGVVGRQPRLDQGQTFVYKSFCPLPTPWGTMEGEFQMEGDDGEWFEIKVGRFYLVAPTNRTPLPA
ncbi:MAG: Co2+/Mg2+ efflux protein ApaG [Phycisphaerales bacterium]|nr:Co2+/Mg2+ efflux protein ApaG [Phycisphaerales bacterium]